MVAALSVVALLVMTCGKEPGSDKVIDTKALKIYELKSRRSEYELKQFIKQERSAWHRSEALKAFASIKDSAYSNFIGGFLLKDSVAEVRSSAAFALGQTGGSDAFRVLQKALDREKDNRVKRQVLEGLGKVLPFSHIGTALLYQPADSAEYLGYVWCLYRMAARRVVNESLMRRMLAYLDPAFSSNIRIPAAACFAVSDSINLSPVVSELSKILGKEYDTEVKLNLIDAIVAVKSRDLFSVIEPGLHDMNWTIRNRVIRGLTVLSWPEAKEKIGAALNDENINNRVAAAITLKQFGIESVKCAKEKITSTQDDEVIKILSDIAARNVYDSAFKAELRFRFDTARSPYLKAGYLEILGRSFSNYGLLKTLVLNDDSPIIRSTAAIALVRLNSLRSFPVDKRHEFFNLYKRGIQTNDVALIKIFCQSLTDPYLNYKSLHEDIEFLKAAREKFIKENNTEVAQPIENAVAFFEGHTPKKLPKHFKPVDWRSVLNIPEKQRIKIETTRGTIVAELSSKDAPETVSRFFALMDEGYFKDQYINDVTSDLLIYFGCSRGDGWSAAGYYMHSELTVNNFWPGVLGVASSGRDTETTHFFITQIPIFYLDGRYTTFGRIKSGMDVLANLRRGDKIIDITIL